MASKISENNSVPARVVKAIRMTTESFRSLMDETVNIMDLDLWSKVNRIVYECYVVDSSGKAEMYFPDKTLKSPELYLPILRNLKEQYGIQIYAGMPCSYSFCSADSINSRSQVDDFNCELFYNSLSQLAHGYGFDGIEFDVHEMENIIPELADTLHDFMYRGKFCLVTPNDYSFVSHYREYLKLISEKIESLVFNSFGFMKYKMCNRVFQQLPKCDCNVEDLKMLYGTLIEYGIDKSKIMVALATVQVMYMMELDDFSLIASQHLLPTRSVEHLRLFGGMYNDNMSYDYIERLDREKQGCVLECEPRGVKISFNTPPMIKNKFEFCKAMGLRGCVVGPLEKDVAVEKENNLINVMNKYII